MAMSMTSDPLAMATLIAQTQRYEGSFGKMNLNPIASKLHELQYEQSTS